MHQPDDCPVASLQVADAKFIHHSFTILKHFLRRIYETWIDVMTRKISIFCAFLGAISVVNSAQASLWGQAVFPDDEKWLSSLAKRKLEDSEVAKNEMKSYKVCETQECKTVAEEFLSSLNKSVDPCNDFYDFACSGWASKNPIPPSSPAWSRFMMFQNTVHHRVKGILETEPKPSDILPVRQAKKWYRSCMDTETLEARGLKPIESILLRSGGWPIAMDEEEWDPDQYSWQEIDRSYARLTGSYTFFDIRADEDMVALLPPDLPLKEHMPIKYRNYSGNDYTQYVEFVAEVADLFVQHNRADISREKLIEDAKDIVEFEKKIYKLQDTYDSNIMPLEEFIEWYDSNVTIPEDDPKRSRIEWQSFLQGLFDTVNIRLEPSTTIYVPILNYSLELSELMEETPKRTIVNYIHWNFVANMLTYTTDAARDALYVLLMEEFGIKERPPRWSECVNEMKMVNAAAYEFVKKYISEHTESEVLKMTKNIQTAMANQIDKSDWLDDESKILAKDKLSSMKIFVGFPDWYKDKKSVLQSYKGLTIGTEYFDNALSYMRYERKKMLKLYLGQEENEDPWAIDPITVNALYGVENVVNIPAADFQAPLFTPQIPDNVNYGIVGVIVGHEIGHGFDDSGIEFGNDGNKTKLPKAILKSYFQRADCFTDQFDKYYGETKPPETTGTTERSGRRPSWRKSLMTRGENIADSTGVQTVFEAYRKLKKPKQSIKLPGLEEFTDDQLFFLSFAAMWCEVKTPEFEKKEKESMDPHSPAKIRVIGAVSNTKGFAEVFKCPAGSPMNPIDKCSIWQSSNTIPRTEIERLSMRRSNRWDGRWKI